MPSLIVRSEASRIEAVTGINPDDLLQEISEAHRTLMIAAKNVNLHKQLKEIKRYALIEKRRKELKDRGESCTESALKAYAYAHAGYREALLAEDESEAQRIEYDQKHKALKERLNLLYKEAALARDEQFFSRQKQ